MSDTNADINRKLRSARGHIALLEADPSREDFPALLESTVFQLMGAYLFFLHNVAQFCGVEDLSGIQCAVLLKKRFDTRMIRCGELDELAALEESDSWLARMCRTYRVCLGEELEEAGTSAAAPAADLLARDSAASPGVRGSMSVEQCRDWYDKLRGTIRRVQAIMVEW